MAAARGAEDYASSRMQAIPWIAVPWRRGVSRVYLIRRCRHSTRSGGQATPPLSRLTLALRLKCPCAVSADVSSLARPGLGEDSNVPRPKTYFDVLISCFARVRTTLNREREHAISRCKSRTMRSVEVDASINVQDLTGHIAGLFGG